MKKKMIVKVKKKEDRSYASWCKIIMNSKYRSVLNHTNADCIVCECIEKYMFRVGAFVICQKCYKKNFKTDNPIEKENETYSKLLKKWNKKYS